MQSAVAAPAHGLDEARHPAVPHRRDRRRRAAVVLAVCLLTTLCGLYAWARLDHGWWPHDEGTLAQAAERVLLGEMPHRDFDDMYTGGQAYLHAAAFRLFGVTLMAPRFMMFGFFLAWVPAVVYVASRFVHPLGAALVALLAVVWSIPTYSAAMPSWYNLFFATFGVAALLRFLDTGHRRWLFVAGAAGGLSCLIKIIGVYYVAAVVLFLLFREQCLSGRSEVRRAGGARLYSLGVSATLLLFMAVLVQSVHLRVGWQGIAHFAVPGCTVAGLLLWREWADAHVGDRHRFVTLARLVSPFALGTALPITLFLIPYALSGAVGALAWGVLVLPALRLDVTIFDPPPLWTMAAVLPVALLLLARPRGSARFVLGAVVASGLIWLLHISWQRPVYRAVWYSLRAMIPVTVVVGALLLSRARTAARLTSRQAQQLMLLVSVSALCSLVQFPFAPPLYFLYVAPIGLLGCVAVVSALHRVASHRVPQPTGPVILGFYLAFAVRWVNTGFVPHMGWHYEPSNQTARLAMERGGLLVSEAHKNGYERLVRVLRAHARGGYIYATPDCPEVYFLTGLRNPTRTLFDFFDEPAGRPARILRALEEHHVHAVAINLHPGFSADPPPELAAALAARFPRSEEVGGFVVRWRP